MANVEFALLFNTVTRRSAWIFIFLPLCWQLQGDHVAFLNMLENQWHKIFILPYTGSVSHSQL